MKTIAALALLTLAFTTGFTCSRQAPQSEPVNQQAPPPAASAPSQEQMAAPQASPVPEAAPQAAPAQPEQK